MSAEDGRDVPPSDSMLPERFFRRVDERPDETFYREPRFVTHIDDATIRALTDFYREVIPPGADILDLMSSWVSHLPVDVHYARVAGLGLNEQELADNPQLTEYVTQDLNVDPELPYPGASFDVVLNAVSIQYLTHPVGVVRSVRRVLRSGGLHAVAISHRCFPTKAIAAWRWLGPDDRVRLVGSYFTLAGGFDDPRFVDRSPPGADPLWIVYARRVDA